MASRFVQFCVDFSKRCVGSGPGHPGSSLAPSCLNLCLASTQWEAWALWEVLGPVPSHYMVAPIHAPPTQSCARTASRAVARREDVGEVSAPKIGHGALADEVEEGAESQRAHGEAHGAEEGGAQPRPPLPTRCRTRDMQFRIRDIRCRQLRHMTPTTMPSSDTRTSNAIRMANHGMRPRGLGVPRGNTHEPSASQTDPPQTVPRGSHMMEEIV